MGLLISWMAGLVRRHPARLVGAMIGVGLALGLLACLGSFVDSSVKTMTARTVSVLPIDWQILLNSSADEGAVRTAVHETDPEAEMETVEYADVPGLVAKTGETMQTTGSAAVLGIDATYKKTFPGEIAPMAGLGEGVLATQQTAANLHVSVGDIVTVQRPGGLRAADVKIDGIISLPDAESIFQKAGTPSGTGPQAPPDDVLVLPVDLWRRLSRNKGLSNRILCVQRCTFAPPDVIYQLLLKLRMDGNCDRLTIWR